jgi:glucose-6-phosphate 1-dehydrogenase
VSTTPRTPAGGCAVVIFGATGDLARRKLLPALVNLAGRRALPEPFTVLAVGRTPMSDDAYREQIARSVREFCPAPADPAAWDWLGPRLFYAFETLDTPASFASIGNRLDAIDGSPAHRAGRLFYLATPPDAMADIVGRLGAAGLLKEEPEAWRRVVFEKPFGHDLASALELNRQLALELAESQIYRIDHYLGKETVQNIMALRFGNGLFEPVWNRRYIDHVQITVAETVGVEDRGGYYDRSGALRDMVQNHLFQLLALTAMEPPISLSAESVRDERVKVLYAIPPFTEATVRSNVVRGQYGPGTRDGSPVPGYRSEPKVPPASATETYFALRLSVDNWRFAGVPFYLRTGKRLPARVSEIAIQFNRPPLHLYQEAGAGAAVPNLLLVRIQPNEGISLQFQAKIPGGEVRLGTVTMAFNYADYFASTPETGYETLLEDCMTGDQTLFHRADMVAAGWQAVAPILDVVGAQPDALLHEYPAGSWGPAAADALLARDGRSWRRPEP